ncbi:SDR family NAD(P)-dependent oxidoreductase [Vibrio splendidus]|uniref:SDR family NAD(P)-dependent oxidoreductase n=1 Tax=Vibrio splendidus TaxID=29497 RepID=UPI000E32C83F|nr:SDR family oxidoreductase [Vibrio splendidus]
MKKIQTIIITGASSGMGKALAQEFLDQGNNIVINSRTESKLQAFVDDNEVNVNRIRFIAGDIGKKSTSEALVQVAIEAFGSIDVLINNAGTFVPKPFLDATEDELDSYYTTAVKGSYFAAQAVIPTMQKQKDGSIINIGSMWVENPIEATPCSASQIAKGAMHTLTRHLAIEFAKDNIRVNTIAPGVIETSLYDNIMDKETLQSLAALHPLHKLGNLDDIKAWSTHLAGNGSRFVTGQTFFIDGGITAGSHSS